MTTEQEIAALDLDAAYPDLGKFEGETNLAVFLYHASMDNGQDEELGDVEGFGWHALFTDYPTHQGVRHAIITEGNLGFVACTEYDSATEAREAWKELEQEYETWDREACADDGY